MTNPMDSTPSQHKNIHLPKTDFPMRAELSKREGTFLKQWQESNLYQRVRDLKKGKKSFVLHDGPPYANGNIHMGHALNKILKDIIVRSHTLLDYDAPYTPGWDCHGLPIEINVEKTHGKKMKGAAFRALCREYAKEQIQIQKKAFERLGILADFQNPYTTMNPKYEAQVVKTLGILSKGNHFVVDVKPVQWCLDCGSSLAEAEVEYKNKHSKAIDVLFKSKEPESVFSCFGVTPPKNTQLFFPIWTTTPWTIPANQALAIGNSILYQLIHIPKKNMILVMARSLFEARLEEMGFEGVPLGPPILGNALSGLIALHPIFQREVPILSAKHVTENSGTGVVHIAGGHGEEDFALIRAHHLKPLLVIQEDGHYEEGLGELSSLFVREAEPTILRLLEENNALLFQKEIEHSYPHCWRHKTPLMYHTTRQVFISLPEALQKKALEAIDSEVQFTFASDLNKIKTILKGRPNWCISRQRLWGTPIPFFIHRKTLKLHPKTNDICMRVASKIEEEGLECWFESKPEDWIPLEETKDYEMLLDVVDVWFDSGASFLSLPQKEEASQNTFDVCLEGKDQFRGWFQSSLWVSMLLQEVPPYRTLVTNGFVVDGNGKKMSKSIGNIISPKEIIDTMGADVLRLWVAQGDYHSDVSVSQKTLTTASDTYRKIRNTIRFLLGSLDGFSPKEELLPHETLLVLDQAILSELFKFGELIKEAYQKHHYNTVLTLIHHFLSEQLGALYLNIIKDRLYTLPKKHQARLAAQTTCYHLLLSITRWISPILPFTSEEANQHTPEAPTKFVAEDIFYQHASVRSLGQEDHDFFQILCFQKDSLYNRCMKAFEEAKNQGNIKQRASSELILSLPQHFFDRLFRHLRELPFLFLCAEVSLMVDPLIQSLSDAKIEITQSDKFLCLRCRTYSSNEEEAICTRCERNLRKETDYHEKRRFL